MSEPRCELTELPVSMCAHCRRHELPASPPEPLYWSAQHAGRCAWCGKPIEPGDDIASTEDGYVCSRRHDDV